MKQTTNTSYTIDEINKKFEDIHSTLKLLSIEGTKPKSKGIVYCNKCKATYETIRERITQWHGCSVCTGKLVVKGINDLATTAPWIMDYLKNKEDGYKYMKSANKKVDLICPNCGYERKMTLNNFNKSGFVCPRCGDGVSYPNKFIRNLLLEMNVDDLQFEYSPDWIKPQRFDTYFELNGNKYIVEMDGGLHFKDNYFGGILRTKEEVQKTDKDKQLSAIQHGINVIRINCTEIENIPKNILDSKLSDLFDLKNFDFNTCQIKSHKSMLLTACEDWNNGMCLFQIAKKYHVCKITISKWLTRGTKLGLCDYSREKSYIRSKTLVKQAYLESEIHKKVLDKKEEEAQRKLQNKLNRRIYVYKEGNLVMICDNLTDCAKKIGELTNNPKACKQNIRTGLLEHIERYGFTYKSYETIQQQQSLQKEIT